MMRCWDSSMNYFCDSSCVISHSLRYATILVQKTTSTAGWNEHVVSNTAALSTSTAGLPNYSWVSWTLAVDLIWSSFHMVPSVLIHWNHTEEVDLPFLHHKDTLKSLESYLWLSKCSWRLLVLLSKISLVGSNEVYDFPTDNLHIVVMTWSPCWLIWLIA